MLALSIGNFDGVHLGHRALMAEARRLAGPTGRVVALTFEPHPLAILRPEARRARLVPAAERRRLLLAAGADEVLELAPTPELLGLEPAPFLQRLRRDLPFEVIVEGPDFRFGRGRTGTAETLMRLGEEEGFACAIVPDVDVALADCTLVRASSTMVRWLLQRGRVSEAAALLGRAHAIEAPNEPGDRRGRTIGVPTLNLARDLTRELVLPGDGVYAGIATLPQAARCAAAISIGVKPSFGASERLCEVHLIDMTLPLDLYGLPLRVEFRSWLREQRAFASVEELVARMRRDIDAARELAALPAGVSS